MSSMLRWMGTALALSVLSVGAYAQEDDAAARLAAANRYLSVVPMSKMLDDMLAEIAKTLPEDKRADFLTRSRESVHADTLEKITRDSITKFFTAEEINAMADFYGSKNGISIMHKFGAYMADVMPQIQAEVIRATKEALAKQKQKGT